MFSIPYFQEGQNAHTGKDHHYRQHIPSEFINSLGKLGNTCFKTKNQKKSLSLFYN